MLKPIMVGFLWCFFSKTAAVIKVRMRGWSSIVGISGVVDVGVGAVVGFELSKIVTGCVLLQSLAVP